MPFNPNAIFISPSSLADLDKCPQLYYYRSVYKTPRGLKLQLTNPALALGSLVHDAIEQFLALASPERTQAELQRITLLLWAAISGEKGGFATPDEEAAYRSRAESMLNRFWANAHFHTCAGVKMPLFPKVNLLPDVILTGKLDWIEQGEDGFYDIIDFKTGKNKEKEDSLQLPIYAILVSSILKTTNLRAKYWYLDMSDDFENIDLPVISEAIDYIRRRAELVQMVRSTKSFRCQSGKESCWACKDMVALAQGKGKLVHIDMSRKQEVYILPKSSANESYASDLPF